MQNNKKRNHLYFGGSGEAAVMSEFLARRYNVAIPEVDVGDDLFVVDDGKGELSRIQVKSGNAEPYAETKGYSVEFNIKLAQIKDGKTPDLDYVFCVRHENRWADFVIIPREQIYEWYNNGQQKFGTDDGHGVLKLYFSFSEKDVRCSNQNLQSYRNNWYKWPVIDHDSREESSSIASNEMP